ncbi:MAG: Acetyl-CoA carboxylase [Acidobacteriaceae bacterium]|nr:Acetyl-CoA carboxylase [Acidobacteriaceae bacterium]
MKQGLFVYGTLHPDRAPEEIQSVVKNMVPIGKGTVVGNLHDLGEYPGLVLDGKRKQRIPGSVFALPDDPDALQALDKYEEFEPKDPDNSLFVRAKRMVTFADGSRKQCWVYIYNQKLPQAS